MVSHPFFSLLPVRPSLPAPLAFYPLFPYLTSPLPHVSPPPPALQDSLMVTVTIGMGVAVVGLEGAVVLGRRGEFSHQQRSGHAQSALLWNSSRAGRLQTVGFDQAP